MLGDSRRQSASSTNNKPGWSDTDAARSTFNRRRADKLDQIRVLACQKCREMGGENNNLVEVSTLLRAMGQATQPDMPIAMKDLTKVLEMEGDGLNGGGTFVITHDSSGRTLVGYEEGNELPSINGASMHQAPGAPIGSGFHGAPGEIGSPISGNPNPFKPGPPPGMIVSPNSSGF